MKPVIYYNIDVVAACNLRCPSCPTGRGEDAPKGVMRPETLEAILTKACRESVVLGIGLFNWTEPFLHPQLAELVRLVNERGLHSDLSTNLNRVKNLGAVMAARPNSIRISCSGYSQPIYELGHRGGNIDTVKHHMAELSLLWHANRRETKIHLLWHRYRHNLLEEPLMKAYCEYLGFGFQSVEAYVMPLERVLDAWNGEGPALPDLGLLTSLAEHKRLVAGRSESCRLQTQQIAIDSRGMVQLCCAVYDAKKFSLVPFLDTNVGQIQQMMSEHAYCGTCSKQGGHIYAMGHSRGGESRLRRAAKAVFKRTAWALPQRWVSKLA